MLLLGSLSQTVAPLCATTHIGKGGFARMLRCTYASSISTNNYPLFYTIFLLFLVLFLFLCFFSFVFFLSLPLFPLLSGLFVRERCWKPIRLSRLILYPPRLQIRCKLVAPLPASQSLWLKFRNYSIVEQLRLMKS